VRYPLIAFLPINWSRLSNIMRASRNRIYIGIGRTFIDHWQLARARRNFAVEAGEAFCVKWAGNTAHSFFGWMYDLEERGRRVEKPHTLRPFTDSVRPSPMRAR